MTDKARDNVDLVIADSMARVIRANPDRYGHVSVWTPPKAGGDPFLLTLDLGGVMNGFAHGHQISAKGPGRIAKIENWWQKTRWSDGQRLEGQNMPTAADCDVLTMAHGHTFQMSQATGRMAIQTPAAEDGSEYFETTHGSRASAGVLTYRVSRKWPMHVNFWEVT